VTRREIPLTASARDALSVLGNQIRLARHGRNWTAAQLAAAAGVSVRTVAAIERGSAAVSIGNALNAAVVVGVPLFGVEDKAELARLRRQDAERLALLPSRVYHPRAETVSDDF
jgi:transcriptional regulator with XRE-family HTH domain